MSHPRPQHPHLVCLPWLIWLALLLPLAQSAASWHALSHFGASAQASDGGHPAANADACDLCLAAAAVSGGGLLASIAGPALAPMRHLLVSTATVGVWLARPTLAYLSRAPPFAPR